ncbi:MAG: NAD(+)/NADH kinase [Bacillota bacterium]|nr:NAD(+)/NADH kinase [Bacillota bacterium]
MGQLLIYNGNNAKAHVLLREAARYILASGGEISGSAEGYSIDDLQREDFCFPSACSNALIFGGDGTILAAVRHLAPLGIPVCGVNMGRVGFLSSLEKEELLPGIDSLLQGNYTVESRMMIHCRVQRAGQIVAEYEAFNDFVVRSGELSRAISYSLFIDQQKVNDYMADGIIVSTPTGSTGYSLSAGGPIVQNDIRILLITPVCAQPFFSCSIVASPESKVEILCSGEADRPSLTADGQSCFSLQLHDRLLLSVAKQPAAIVSIRPENYFARIRKKLYRSR